MSLSLYGITSSSVSFSTVCSQPPIYDYSITNKYFADGTDIMDITGMTLYYSKEFQTNNTITSFSDTITGLSASTPYTFYAGYTDVNYKWHNAGSASCTTSASSSRPSTFSWTYSKTSGGDFKVSADEWNAFANNINLVRTYKGLSTIGFTSASVGMNFYASMFNQAISAINDMISIGIAFKNTNDNIVANEFNSLVSTLNSIT